MDEISHSPATVEDLVAALTEQLSRQVQAKPHPWVTGALVANMAFIAGLVFAAGALYQRVNGLEERIRTVADSNTIAAELQGLRGDIAQIRRDQESQRDRIDRALDVKGK